jgi:hypothetical protein
MSNNDGFGLDNRCRLCSDAELFRVLINRDKIGGALKTGSQSPVTLVLIDNGQVIPAFDDSGAVFPELFLSEGKYE